MIKKSIKILMILILSILLIGCNFQQPITEDYIDIEKLYNENKEVIDLAVASIDIEEYSKRDNFEYISNDVYLNSKFSVMYFKKMYGIRIKFEKVMYYYSRNAVALMYEMKNEQAAKEVYEQLKIKKPESLVLYEKNIVYFDHVIFNLMMKNYRVEDDNYVTLDGKTFLTNLSNNETIYVPDAKEIVANSCVFHTNIKSVHMNDNIEKINYGAFYGCYNLENVYLNNGLKEIDSFAFYRCFSLKYVVIPDSVEIIKKNTFSDGIIYCEAVEKPEGWDAQFASSPAKIYWGNEWEYNEEGVPVVIENSSKK